MFDMEESCMLYVQCRMGEDLYTDTEYYTVLWPFYFHSISGIEYSCETMWKARSSSWTVDIDVDIGWTARVLGFGFFFLWFEFTQASKKGKWCVFLHFHHVSSHFLYLISFISSPEWTPLQILYKGFTPTTTRLENLRLRPTLNLMNLESNRFLNGSWDQKNGKKKFVKTNF